MARYQVQSPDGQMHIFEGPDGATPDQVLAVAQQTLGAGQPKPSIGGMAAEGLAKIDAYNPTDARGGALRGAGSIGATITDFLRSKLADPVLSAVPQNMRPQITSDLATVPRGADLRAGMDQGVRAMGADTSSVPFGMAKLGAEVAGTSGIGGAIAKGIGMLPGAAQALPTLLPAIQSGGMSANGATGLYGMANRIAGGAINGGLTAGAIDPNEATTGALIGGALPPAIQASVGAGRMVGNGIAGLTKNTLGMTTGAGAETFGTAYRAGKEGGTSFLDNMRGNVPMTDVLDSAKEALAKMRVDRGTQYRSGMIDIAKDKSVIDFAPIDNAVSSLQKMGSFKGQVINKNAAGTVDEISSLVSQWKSLDPAEYHTPEGLDALKKAIGDIRDATQFGTPGRKAADTAYNSVKAQINLQAPTYAKVMNDYSQASDTLKEIEKALSLGDKAAADTSMRKLQSLMRNNVNTNYGNRLGLAKTLEGQGADILPAVAGQAASSITPRGLQGLAATGAGFASLINPLTLTALPFTSPRLMGELSYGLGAMSRFGGAGSNALPGLQQGLLGAQPAGQSLGPLLTQGAYRAAPLLGAKYLSQ